MGCLTWPQKKALKIAFKLIDKKLGNNPNNPQAMNANIGTQPPQQNQGIASPENIRMAMNLMTKVLDLWLGLAFLISILQIIIHYSFA